MEDNKDTVRATEIDVPDNPQAVKVEPEFITIKIEPPDYVEESEKRQVDNTILIKFEREDTSTSEENSDIDSEPEPKYMKKSKSGDDPSYKKRNNSNNITIKNESDQQRNVVEVFIKRENDDFCEIKEEKIDETETNDLVSNSNAMGHGRNKARRREVDRFDCSFCGLSFHNKLKDKHLLIHMRRKLSPNDEKSKDTQDFKNSLTYEDGALIDKRLLYFRCTKCSCVMRYGGRHLKFHRCSPRYRYTCRICGLTMNIHHEKAHLSLHEEQDFTMDDIIFKYFDPVLNNLGSKHGKDEFKKYIYSRCSKCKCVIAGDGGVLRRHRCISCVRYKCRICGLKMNMRHKRIHLKLHKDMNLTINDIAFKYFDPIDYKDDVTIVEYEKIIYYKCNKCSCVMRKGGFHLKGHKCTTENPFKCDKCNLKMHPNYKRSHLMYHEERTFTENDLIIKSFDPNQSNFYNEIVYHRCRKCSCIMIGGNRQLRQHVCRSRFRFTCDLCGLTMNTRVRDGHLLLHKEMNLSLDDIIFKYFDPIEVDCKEEPVTESNNVVYNRCRKCKFIIGGGNNHMMKHICGSQSRFTCKFCGLTMHPKIRDKHLSLHSDKKLTIDDISFKYFDPIKREHSTYVVPDETKKVVYNRCSKCNCLIGDGIRHLKRHLCGSRHQITCKYCGLLMDVKIKDKHLTLHKEANLTLEDIGYKYFEPIQKLLKPSSPSSELNDSKKIVYDRCSKCECILGAGGRHLKRHICNNRYRFNCPICGLSMNKNLEERHSMLHTNMNISIDDIGFKYFDPLDKKEVQANDDSKKIVYYRCSQCSCVMLSGGSNLTQHTCGTHFYTCDICGLKMNKGNKITHIMSHEKRNFTLDDVVFKDFAPSGSNPEDDIIYYRCRKCKIVLTGGSSRLTQHKCNTRLRYKCNICDVSMHKMVKYKHIKLHSEREFTKKDIIFKYFDPVKKINDSDDESS